jgi:hypothetical protein
MSLFRPLANSFQDRDALPEISIFTFTQNDRRAEIRSEIASGDTQNRPFVDT